MTDEKRQDIDDVVLTDKREWENPPEGDYDAVICDVIDRGKMVEEYGGKKKMVHKAALGIQLPDRNSQGERFVLRWFFNVSSAPNSKLVLFLVDAFGKKVTEKMLKAGLRLNALIGKNLCVEVIHKKSADGTKTYANVAKASKYNGEPFAVENYIRVRDREVEEAPAPEETNDNVPF